MFSEDGLKPLMKRKHLLKTTLKTLAVGLCALFLTASFSAGFMRGDKALADDGPENRGVADPVNSGEGYSAVIYDNKSGLPTSEANAIAQTREGFIWIGSYSGLIRYDGNTFVNLSTDAGVSSVVSLYVDSSDRLWIGTNDSGVSVMEKGNFRRFGRPEGLNSLSVRAICEDKQGNIFIGTTDGLSYIDKNMFLHNLNFAEFEHDTIRTLKASNEGTIYGVTLEGSVFTLKDMKLTGFYNEKALNIDGARSVLTDDYNPGYLYIGDAGHTIYYGSFIDGAFSLSRKFLTGDKLFINDIENFGGTMWVCTDKGIGYFDDFHFISISDSPMTTSVENVMVDHNYNLWFASSQQGIMKIVPNQFTDIFKKYNLPESVVYTTCVYNDTMYIGTKNSGLIVIKNGEVQDELTVKDGDDEKDLIAYLADSKIRSINADSKGTVWFSTFGNNGLVGLKNGKITKIKADDGLPSNRVRTVLERKDGSLLVCCTGGLAIVEDGKVKKVYTEKDGLTNTEILTAALMDNGDIVLGTDGGGIFVISDAGIKNINVDSGLSSDIVMRVKKDRTNDIMWLVTSNSICYMNSRYQVTRVENFPYLNNFDIYENGRGEMWVLSSSGIYVAKVDDVLSNKPFRYLYYGIHNGLPSISTSNSYSEQTSDGYLYMACTSGVIKVNIEEEAQNTSTFNASVPFVEADGVVVYPKDDGSFSISASTQKLTIYSYVFNYSLINPEVTYQLQGFDKSAVTVTRNNLKPVDYTNLKAGKYKFHMSVVDPHNGQSYELSVHIDKEKHFHEYWTFRIIVFVAAVALITVIVSLIMDRRTKKLIAKNNEQKKFIREVVEAFARVIDMKDQYTRGHSIRVAHYTAMLAKEMGIDEDTIEKYYNIALLHDIGKIGISDEVLNKPGKLNDEEYATIQSHSSKGYDTLKDISIMPELAIGAGSHHERPDGKGYPHGLKGQEIPTVARIIAVADTFDAMYSNRPYRNRMPFSKVLSIIKEIRGTQLDEEVVDAFLRLVDQGQFRAPDDDS